jgi:hypothetical protein
VREDLREVVTIIEKKVEIADMAEATEVTEVIEATEVTEVTEVAEVAEAEEAAEVASNKEITEISLATMIGRILAIETSMIDLMMMVHRKGLRRPLTKIHL